MISNHIAFLRPASLRLIAFFGKQELRIDDSGIALVGGHQLTAFCFFWIECIGRSVMQTLRHSLALVTVHGNDASGSYKNLPLQKKLPSVTYISDEGQRFLVRPASARSKG